MEETMEKSILVTGTSQPLDWKIEIQSNKDKYFFSKTTKDGQPTKAYTQFQELRPMAGDVLKAIVSESPKSFVGRDGQTVNFTERRIMYFITENPQSAPQVSQAPVATPTIQQPSPSVVTPNPVISASPKPDDYRIQMLQDDVADLKVRVAELEDSRSLPIIDYGNPEQDNSLPPF